MCTGSVFDRLICQVQEFSVCHISSYCSEATVPPCKSISALTVRTLVAKQTAVMNFLYATPAPQSKRDFVSASIGSPKVPIAAFALLIIALSVLVLSRPSRADSNDTPPYLTSPLRTDTEPIHVRLSGRDYYIPANYFDAVINSGVDQRDILLVALLPSLEPRTRENWDEFMKVPGFGRRVHLLVEALDRPEIGLEAALQASEYMWGPFEVTGIDNGLERRDPVGAGRFRKRREVFIDRIRGDLATLVVCTRDGDFRKPSCEQYFMAGGLRIKATYAKQFLPIWHSIQESVNALLQRSQR